MKQEKDRIIERRKYVRLSLDANVKCKIEGRIEGALEMVKCHNISPEGLCISSKKPLKIGMPISIEIAIKDDKPFSIRGEVIWVKEVPGDAAKKGQAEFRTGIKILDVGSDRNRFLLRLCDEMLGKLNQKYPKMKF